MKLEHTSRDGVVRHIARSFQSKGEVQATYLGVIAEHLRAGCLILGTADTPLSCGIASSIQLCKQTSRRVTPLFPEEQNGSQVVRDELRHLQEMGDLVRIDGHYASVAPARRLAIEPDRSLLIGGGTIGVLPSVIQKKLVVSGRARILTSEVPPELQQAYPLQRLEDWLGLEDDDMLKWANEFVAIKVGTKCDMIPEGLRFWNGRSWCSPEDFDGPNGACLCRRNISHFGNPMHEYGLIKLRRTSGHLQISSHISIEKEVARKLQGALRPVRPKAEQFVVTEVRPGIVELTLRHPIAEQHVKLLHLGWKASGAHVLDAGVQKIEFSERLLPILSRGFGLIGYELVCR